MYDNKLLDEVLKKTLNQNIEINSSETIEDVLKYLEEIEGQNTSALNINNINYDAPEGSNYILIETITIKRILECVSNIIDLSSIRAVSRGISIKPVDNTKVDLVCPNPLYYFKTVELAKNTLEEGTTIFIEYLFLTKIAKFLPPRILIYSKEENVNGHVFNKYYIRLTTGDLELINTTLISKENNMVNINYNLSEEPIKVLDAKETGRKINALLKMLPCEHDSHRRKINVRDGRLTFYAPSIYLQSNLDFLDTTIDTKIAKYICSACKYNDRNILIYAVSDDSVDKYAIVIGEMTMITILKESNDDSIVTERLSLLNSTAKLDYIDTKYNLDYITSITYAIGNLYLKKSKDLLTGIFKLQNGSSSNITLKINGYLDLPDDKSIRISSKTLLNTLKAFDSTAEVGISFRDGVLFLENDDVKAAIITL